MPCMSVTKPDDEYSDAEIAERMARTIRRALNTPHVAQTPKPKKRGRPPKRVLVPPPAPKD